MKHEDYGKLKMLIPAASAPACPAEISLQSIKDIPLHIHDGVELLYVLKGSINIRISFNSYRLTEGDFLLINNYEEPICLDGLAEREYIDKYYAAHLIKSGTAPPLSGNT